MTQPAIIPPKIKANPLPTYRVMYELPADCWLVINMGGRGGAKSYETAKFAAIMAIQKQKRIAILRDQQNTIEQSILNEIKLRFDEINIKSEFFYSQFYDFQKRGLKHKATGQDLIFTKGFQTSQVNQKAALKSISDVDIAIIEEFEDIRDEQKFNTFADSIRKEGSVIIVNLNTPEKNHWFIKRFYHLQESEYEGYYRAVPRNIKGVVYTFTTFADNPHLPVKTVEKYKAYGDPTSELYNMDYYCSSMLGLVSEGRKGRIFRNWKPISYTDFQKLPYASFAGLDFGYSNDPNALLEIKAHNNKRYIRKAMYKNGLSNEEIAKEIEINLPKRCPVYADSAEPKSIAALRNLNINIWPALKGADSILSGIRELQNLEVFYVPDPDLENEYQEYTWALDVNGLPTDKPVDRDNHLIGDAFRYGEATHQHRTKQTLKVNRNFR